MVNSEPNEMVRTASEAAATLRLVLAECDGAASPTERLREVYLRGALHALESLTASAGLSPDELSGDGPPPE